MNTQTVKPIAVHLHLYYTDMWEELASQLQNIENTPYELFVTLVEDNPDLSDKIQQFHSPSHISVVKNMGYDVGPFMEFLNSINLDKYDYILKLHSKRPSNGTDTKLKGLPVNRYYWKVLLSEALIGCPKIWQNNLQKMNSEKKLGMIASPHLIKKIDKTDKELIPAIKNNLQKLKLPIIENFSFVAGTMFIVRSHLLKPLQHQYTIDDFQQTDGQVKDGTLAHVLERLFGGIVYAQDYKIKGFHYNYKFVLNALVKITLRFIYQKKITKSNKLIIKVCKLPIYQSTIS